MRELKFHADEQHYRYPSRRSVVYGSRGMVCTASQLAAQAGLAMLRKGGNAVDAAIATAICLTVVEPVSNGIGADAFAIVWMKDKMYGLNSSGWAPQAATPEAIRKKGFEAMPKRGWMPVTVSGAPAAWISLSRRFGKLPFGELFEPAIDYARNGYPVSSFVANTWRREYKELLSLKDDKALAGWFETFLKDGRTPRAGEMMKLPDHAKTLEKLRDSECESFYRGEIADAIDAFSRETGGLVRKEDYAEWSPLWVEPVSVNYRGYDVWELPPNGHGIVPLMALNILKGLDFKERDCAETLHRQFEAMKMAFADGDRYITDPKYMNVSVASLLSDRYGAARRAEITGRALMPHYGDPNCGGTVYLCTADGEGNMVSYIQSNYCGFGSGVVVPGYGIAIQNRGFNFNLNKEHVNCIAPHKRTYHTIIPGFLTKEGRAVGPFGVMGGFMQPQGHLQVITNVIDFHMNPQEALDAPRWQWTGGLHFDVEPGLSLQAVEQLRMMGHEIRILDDMSEFGRGEIIWRNEEGVLAGATEPRADGVAAAW